MVDKDAIQFTIPVRSNIGADEYGKQKLFGVLRMEDRKKGNELAPPFAKLIQELAKHSIAIKGISEDKDCKIDIATGLPL